MMNSHQNNGPSRDADSYPWSHYYASGGGREYTFEPAKQGLKESSSKPYGDFPGRLVPQGYMPRSEVNFPDPLNLENLFPDTYSKLSETEKESRLNLIRSYRDSAYISEEEVSDSPDKCRATKDHVLKSSGADKKQSKEAQEGREQNHDASQHARE